jgi:hypothetical protein
MGKGPAESVQAFARSANGNWYTPFAVSQPLGFALAWTEKPKKVESDRSLGTL